MVRANEPTANRAIKVRLFPTEKQKKFMKHNINVSRATYNWAVEQNLKEYKIWDTKRQELLASLPDDISEEDKITLLGKEKKKYITDPYKLCNAFTQEIKNNEKFQWFKKHDSIARANTIAIHYKNAIKHFKDSWTVGKTKGKTKKKEKEYPYDYGFPQFKNKTKGNSYPTRVYVHQIDRERHRISLPLLGWVKYSSNQEIPYFDYPSKEVARPVISTDGEYFYLSFGYYAPFDPVNKNESQVLGVDLGMKHLAVLSDGTIIENLANDETVKKYNKKIKKIQRKINWLLEHSEPHWKLKQETPEKSWNKAKWRLRTRQIKRLEKRRRKVQNNLNHYRQNKLHEICHEIIMKNPQGFVFEDLAIKNMQQNRRHSSKLQQTGMYTFKMMLVWHAKKHNIPCKQVSRTYASSQNCSNCGVKNPEMKDMSIRTFVCPNCGHVMDRDLNAAINLASQWNEVKGVKLIA